MCLPWCSFPPGMTNGPDSSMLSSWVPATGKILFPFPSSTRCPCPTPPNLWICYVKWQRGLCRYDEGSWDGKVSLDYPGVPNLTQRSLWGGRLEGQMCRRRRSNDGRRDMTTEAEGALMPLLGGDHEQRNAGSHQKPKQARTGFSQNPGKERGHVNILSLA